MQVKNKILFFLILISLSALLADDIKDEEKKIQVINLGPDVNFSDLDYAPTVTPDGKVLFFVSNRKGSKIQRDGSFSHDFWASKKSNKYDFNFSEPYNIDTSGSNVGVNTTYNEGVLSIAADNKTLFFTACGRNDGRGSCDIYYTKNINGKWTKPKNLGTGVNSKYWESMPSISPDMKRLYFISNRPVDGEDRGEEIWFSDWDPDYKEWKEAKNLKSLNTKGRESSVFIAADNLTLFFSSDGRDPNIGGMDFYVSRFDRTFKSWTEPALLSEPINSKYDDEFLTFIASGDVMYFCFKKRKDRKSIFSRFTKS